MYLLIALFILIASLTGGVLVANMSPPPVPAKYDASSLVSQLTAHVSAWRAASSNSPIPEGPSPFLAVDALHPYLPSVTINGSRVALNEVVIPWKSTTTYRVDSPSSGHLFQGTPYICIEPSSSALVPRSDALEVISVLSSFGVEGVDWTTSSTCSDYTSPYVLGQGATSPAPYLILFLRENPVSINE